MNKYTTKLFKNEQTPNSIINFYGGKGTIYELNLNKN